MGLDQRNSKARWFEHLFHDRIYMDYSGPGLRT